MQKRGKKKGCPSLLEQEAVFSQCSGIEFKPSHSLKDISFNSRLSITGQLKLPTFVIDNSTKRMLLNLVTFEMCLPGSHENQHPWLTSDINLLELLIDNKQDIKNLQIKIRVTCYVFVIFS